MFSIINIFTSNFQYFISSNLQLSRLYSRIENYTQESSIEARLLLEEEFVNSHLTIHYLDSVYF